MLRQLLAACAARAALSFLPYANPPWGASNYNMSESTISMACNSSGPLNTTVFQSFGITSVDWSNQKAQWAAARPMDDQERLVTQAGELRAANPRARVFSYFNLVKALPWMSSVRRVLADPAYAGFFLRFKPGGAFPNGSYHVPACDTTYDPPLCSEFYHDQEQSPAVPSPANPSPDGACVGHCDCGGVPCGEYLFDWRNGSMLTDFIVNEILLGPLGMGSGVISGFFLDDFWCANLVNGTGACTDPVQGPTEIDAHSQADMGLTDADVADITRGWLAGFTAAQAALERAGGYTWSRIPGQDNANAQPVMAGPDAASCTSLLRRACSPASPWRAAPLLFGMHMGADGQTPPFATADVAAFLLARGPWAWMGAGVWGMSWPTGLTWNASNTPVSRPPQLDADYGEPVGGAPCAETAPGSGIFTRQYTRASVRVDCANYAAATISPASG